VTFWLVTFTINGNLLGGAITEADTFLAALDRLSGLYLIPAGAACRDYRLPAGMGEDLRDRFLEPGEVAGLLGELGTGS
jgi:hypothetical protein